MRAKDIITLEIKEDSTWVDYSDGTLTIEIFRGLPNEYIGPWEPMDFGQMILRTRNQDIDPYRNDFIRVNREIRVLSNSNPIFTGRISNVDVDYRRKNEDSVITLNAIDFIGTMARHILSDNFIKMRSQNWNIENLLQDLGIVWGFNDGRLEIEGFDCIEDNVYGSPNHATGINTGTSAGNILATFASQESGYLWANKLNQVVFYDNQEKWSEGTAPYLQASKIAFRSDGNGTSYKNIVLSDGFDRIVNQISFTNSGGEWNFPTNDTFTSYSQGVPTYTNTYSKNNWGSSQYSINTSLTREPIPVEDYDDYFEDLSLNIFEESANPQREVTTIVWNALLDVDAAEGIELFDNIDIYHQLPLVEIDRKYSVLGIRHFITESDWDITYALRNYFAAETSFPTPIITADEGIDVDIDLPITFSIINIDDIDVTEGSFSWKYTSGTVPGGLIGEFSTDESPTETYTISEVGVKNVTCTITDSYGFTKTSDVYTFTVFGVSPSAVSFTHTPNPSNSGLIEFTATATNATSYEWDFGDGNTITTSSNIYSHLYDESDTYTVSLTATNAHGSAAPVSQNVAVTLPAVPTNETGTFPLRHIKIGLDYFYGGLGYYWPAMYNFKALTSATLTDRASSSLLDTLPYQFTGEPWGNHFWQEGNKTAFEFPFSEALRNGGEGIIPNNTGDGTANWALFLDLGQAYYDINDLDLTFSGAAKSGAPTFLNVYATTQQTFANPFNKNNATWVKIGTISRFNGNFTPLSNLTLPLMAEPNNNFTFTVSSDAPYENNKYTFTTDDWLTSSYDWDFGDGNTSTEQNPIHVYTSNGSKTVTLTKTDSLGNQFITTQTINVNILTSWNNPFSFRFVKFVQNNHTGTHKYDTPYIVNFRPFYQNNIVDYTGTTNNTVKQFNLDFIVGTGGPFGPPIPTATDIDIAPNNTRLVGDNGLRVRSLDAEYKTGWETIVDYGQTIEYIDKMGLKVGKFLANDQTEPTVASGISYSIYLNDNLTDPSLGTWTFYGTITPTSIPTDSTTFYYTS